MGSALELIWSERDSEEFATAATSVIRPPWTVSVTVHVPYRSEAGLPVQVPSVSPVEEASDPADADCVPDDADAVDDGLDDGLDDDVTGETDSWTWTDADSSSPSLARA